MSLNRYSIITCTHVQQSEMSLNATLTKAVNNDLSPSFSREKNYYQKKNAMNKNCSEYTKCTKDNTMAINSEIVIVYLKKKNDHSIQLKWK